MRGFTNQVKDNEVSELESVTISAGDGEAKPSQKVLTDRGLRHAIEVFNFGNVR